MKTGPLVAAVIGLAAGQSMLHGTATAHVASAFRLPQLVLFGPTNPFHWHPMHPRAAVARAGFEGPLDHFEPRQKGLPMSELSTEAVIRAMEVLLERFEIATAGE